MSDFLTSLENSIQNFAQKPALKSGKLEISYQQLGEITDQLAHEISARPNKFPVFYLGKLDIFAHVYSIACIKAGTPFVPIDIRFKSENIQKVFEALDVSATILTDRNTDQGLYPGLQFEILSNAVLKVNEKFINRDGLPLPEPDTIILYQVTSGTTGSPKIIARTYEDLAAHNRLSCLGLEIPSEYTIGNPGNFVLEHLCIALLNGATMSFCQLSDASIHEIETWLRNDAINMLQCYAEIFRIFQRVGGPFDDIKIVIVYGDLILKSDLDIFARLCPPDAKLYNAYGTQEAGYSTAYLHKHGEQCKTRYLPLGNPLNDVSLVLVDEEGKPVSQGDTGEIVIREPSMSIFETGYISSDQTRPHLRYNNGKPIGFSTGDLAWKDADGCLFFAGRVDDQVRINGYNVQLLEVENAVLGLDEISEAVVTIHELSKGSRVLCCHYVGDASPLKAQQDLKDKLPSYMQPHYFRKLEKLPRNANGKIVKNELTFHQQSNGQNAVDALNRAESKMRSIWSSVLEHSEFNASSNFSDVGGDSLAAIKLNHAIEDEFGVSIGFREFSQSGMSISGLLHLLQTKGAFEQTEALDKKNDSKLQIPSVSAAELMELNKKILDQWAAKSIEGFEFFRCENHLRDATPVVWIFQTETEYQNLSEALGSEFALYGGRSFSSLWKYYDHLDADDWVFYEDHLVLQTARAYLAEILELVGGRSFILGGNCQSSIISLCMAERLASMNHKIKGLVILNLLNATQTYSAPTTLLFGQEEYNQLNRQHPEAFGSFPNKQVKIIDGAHGTYFDVERVHVIANTIREFC